MLQILLNEEPVYRRRRTERRYVILFQHRQHITGVEAVEVVHEIDRARQPLAVELAPSALGPAAVRNRDMHALIGKVVPERTGCRLTQGIGIVMRNHLRHTGCAGGKVDKHHVVVGVWHIAVEIRLCLGEQLIIVQPVCAQLEMGRLFALRRGIDLVARGLVDLVRRDAHLGHRPVDFLDRLIGVADYLRVARADDHLCARSLYSVCYVLFLKLMRGGNMHAAQLHQSQCQHPEFVPAL